MRMTKLLGGGSVVLLFAAVVACSDDDAPATPTSDAGSDTGATGSDGGGTDGASGDAATDSGNDAGGTTLGAGPYSIVYAGTFVGIDSRPVAAGKATFDGAKLTGYEASTDERPTAGTNTVVDVASGPRFAIGRWSGGTTGGKFYDVGGSGVMTFTANGGFQYAIGIPADPLPSTGAAAYAVDAKTKATQGDGTLTPGTVNGSLAAVYAGGTTKIGFTLSLDVPGDATYTVETTGGVANPATSDAELGGGNTKGFFFLNKTITSAGAACAGGGSCTFAVDGLVLGANGENVAIAAHVYSGSGGAAKSVSGVIVFKKQ